jgi:hypothetical protein
MAGRARGWTVRLLYPQTRTRRARHPVDGLQSLDRATREAILYAEVGPLIATRE